MLLFIAKCGVLGVHGFFLLPDKDLGDLIDPAKILSICKLPNGRVRKPHSADDQRQGVLLRWVH